MNDYHESRIISAVEIGDGYALDVAINSVCGNRLARRQKALGTINRFLRSGGELPLPDLIPYQILNNENH
jgi:hypothetical protein